MRFEIRQYQLEDKPKVVQLMSRLQDFFVEIDTNQELKSIMGIESLFDKVVERYPKYFDIRTEWLNKKRQPSDD